jgi:putative ABC transport system permease protein
MLTALGVIFGVAAVIAMLAIGSGAKAFILDQMRLIGTNNIVIEHQEPSKSKDEPEDVAATTTANNESKLKTWAPGISVADLDIIEKDIRTIDVISPEIIRETKAIFNGKLLDIRCVGVRNAFFSLNQLDVSRGQLFTQTHFDQKKAVCVMRGF